MKPTRIVYIAGPFSSDPVMGTRAAILTMAQLRSVGLGAICPHLSLLAEIVAPLGYQSWIDLDLALLERCDAVLVLPGKSPGAELEEEHARGLGMPVYRDLGQCICEMSGAPN